MNIGNRQVRPGIERAITSPDQLGRLVARQIEGGLEQLPHDITERLRAARMQALSQRKRPVAVLAPQPVAASGAIRVGPGSAALVPDDRPGLWQVLGSALPILMLIVGLVVVNDFQSESRARELAEVDTALLTDDVPPAAYADPGFLHFMQAEE